MITHYLHTTLIDLGLSNRMADLLTVMLIILLVLVAAFAVAAFTRYYLLKLIKSWIKNNKTKWDDPLVTHSFLSRVTWFIPVLFISLSIDALLPHDSTSYIIIKRLVMSGFVIVSVLSLNALLSTANDIYKLIRKTHRGTLQGYVDAAKIISSIVGVIFLISIFTGKSPMGIFSILGGLTALTLLIFKDSILGFIASIQLTGGDMIRVGDWIEMPKFGADGDVIQMSINSVRVRNWDKTITTIPTYALVSSSFKNWRGMSESGGRRIKRCLDIDLGSIRFCDEAMLEKLARVDLLQEYLEEKNREITSHNQGLKIDSSSPLNGRSQTNIGIFRAYIISYLKNNPKIHKNMTFLVRHKPPTENGLPLEIYVFSNDQVWANYEAIQADIFDHLLAAAPEFGLRIFQNPSGYDVRSALAGSMSELTDHAH